ncbi:ribonuclease Z [Lacihabitans sp. LS3-19]|uniref:ribonuclease Z n=1 Tax=Lacihabitans sp. LS3-19 TaxID=2487335 RepID=UPI0020CE8D8D|nr:ribonuclease Z [Lacihabitans sp. LS3-19]MCP9767016.1 ribonuclease Z [Lacihabitans sp. LS3-19]
MEFRILGTGSATPQLQRNPSAFTLAIDNFLILIDCGEGTQYRLLQYKIKSFRIKYILISHLHGDHYFGLIGLISTMNMQKRKETLTVFGPKGLNEIITQQLKYSGSILNFKLEFVQTNSEKFEEIFSDDTIKIDSFPLKHRIECTGFLVTKKNSKRKIIADKLPPNFPIPFYRLLKDGFDVNDELNGEVYKNSEYTTEGSNEKKFAYCSDTIFDKSVVKYVKNADLLYHESTFTTELENRAQATFHSTAAQAAQIATLAKVGQLVIGHFSSRYKTEELFLEEAKAVFSQTALAEEGKNFII